MSITINSTTLASLGWKVRRTTGVDDFSTRRVPLIEVPGRGESIEGSRYPVDAPREVTATVWTRDTDLATIRTRLANLDYLLSSRDLLRFEHVRRPSRELLVRCVSGPAGWGPGAGAVGPYFVEGVLRFTAPSPHWQDTSDQVVNFTSSPVAVPLGTKPSRGVISLTAPSSNAVNPTLLYKTPGGTTVASFTLAHTILVGDAWEANLLTGGIRKRVSGVWSNAIDTLAAGFALPVTDPRDGNYLTASWPTLQVDAGSGAYTYRRRD